MYKTNCATKYVYIRFGLQLFDIRKNYDDMFFNQKIFKCFDVNFLLIFVLVMVNYCKQLSNIICILCFVVICRYNEHETDNIKAGICKLKWNVVVKGNRRCWKNLLIDNINKRHRYKY